MSQEAFNLAISFILPHETEFQSGHYGDYAFARTEDVPGDSGGLTKFGIDQGSHPSVDIAALDKDGAVSIYHQEWRRRNLDLLPDKLAVTAFDVWVNGGSASLWLQQAFNETHPSQALNEDGSLGPASLNALANCDVPAVLNGFCTLRENRFRRLAQNPNRAKFLKGWMQRSTDLRALLA